MVAKILSDKLFLTSRDEVHQHFFAFSHLRVDTSRKYYESGANHPKELLCSKVG